jgi:hypothetical protein
LHPTLCRVLVDLCRLPPAARWTTKHANCVSGFSTPRCSHSSHNEMPINRRLCLRWPSAQRLPLICRVDPSGA